MAIPKIRLVPLSAEDVIKAEEERKKKEAEKAAQEARVAEMAKSMGLRSPDEGVHGLGANVASGIEEGAATHYGIFGALANKLGGEIGGLGEGLRDAPGLVGLAGKGMEAVGDFVKDKVGGWNAGMQTQMQQASEAHQAAGVQGPVGELFRGLSNLGYALPALQTGGLAIWGALSGWASQNPDAMVELYPGGPVVSGQTLGALVGGAQGLALHGSLQATNMVPGLAAPRAAGAAIFTLPGTTQDIAEKKPLGTILSNMAVNAAEGAIMTPGRPQSPFATPGAEAIQRATEFPEQKPLPGMERIAAEVGEGRGLDLRPGQTVAQGVAERTGQPLPEDLGINRWGGPLSTGQQTLPDVGMEKGILTGDTVPRPAEEPPLFPAKKMSDMPQFLQDAYPHNQVFDDMKSADTVNDFVNIATEFLSGARAREAARAIERDLPVFSIPDPVTGEPTRYLAHNARTILRNIVKLYDRPDAYAAYGTEARDPQRLQDFVDLAKLALELPESSFDVNIAPALSEQIGFSIGGLHQPGTGMVVLDPSSHGTRTGSVEAALHEIVGHRMLKFNMARLGADAEGRMPKDVSKKAHGQFVEAAQIAPNTTTDEETLYKIMRESYGASDRAEAEAESLTRNNMKKLYQRVWPGEEGRLKAEAQHEEMRNLLKRPRAALSEAPVPVKLGQATIINGKTAYQVKIPTLDANIGYVTTKNILSEGQRLAMERLIGEQVGRSTVFAGGGDPTAALPALMAELAEKMRDAGFEGEFAPHTFGLKMAIERERERQKAEQPRLFENDERVPVGGGQGGRAREPKPGERNWPTSEDLEVDEAKVTRAPGGRYKQERLPDESDDQTYLAIRMKDGTIFTSDKDPAHAMMAERLGLIPMDIKDAGYWSYGQFERAEDTQIHQWADYFARDEKKLIGDADGWRYFALDTNGERTYWKKRIDEPWSRARELQGLTKSAREFYDKKIGETPQPKSAPVEIGGFKLDLDFTPRSDEYSLGANLVKKSEEFKSPEDILKYSGVDEKGAFVRRLDFDPEKLEAKDVTPKVLDTVGAVKQSPEYSALFDKVYEDAKEVPWQQGFEFKTAKTTHKLANMMVIKLTSNCQRFNALSFYKQFGLVPSDWSIEPCYGGSCWADRKVGTPQNMRVKGYESIAERQMKMVSPEGIERMWASAAFRRDAKATPFFRHGQTGDDSHSIHLGLVRKFLEEQAKWGDDTKSVFISAGYAPTTPEDYQALAPYKDKFVIHFSVSGWEGFPKADMLNRINEFRMAREAGLDAVFRVITNKDLIDNRMKKSDTAGKVVKMTNEKWLFDTLASVAGVNKENGQFYILETPYHNDFLPRDVARSKPALEWAQECCKDPVPDVEGKGAQCQKCGVMCFTKVGKTWRMEHLDLSAKGEESGLDINAAPKVDTSKAQYDDLVLARERQIDEFIRRTALPEEQAAKVRQVFSEPGMEEVFGPGILKKREATPEFGQKEVPPPSAPGVKFQKPEVPGAGEKGPNRWEPIAKRYGIPTVTEKELADSGIDYLGTPDEPRNPLGQAGQQVLPGMPEPKYALMPTPDVVKFTSKLEDPVRLPGADEIETPMRFIERIGGGKNNPLKDLAYRAPKAGEDATKQALENLHTEMKGYFKSLGINMGFKESERLGRIMVGRQHLGGRILEVMGVKPVKDITPAEEAAVKWMDERLLQMFHDVNAAREAAGQQPIKWRKDYFTFWHIASNMESEGISLLSSPAETINKVLTLAEQEYMRTRTPEQLARERKRSSIWFRFAQKRSGKLGPVDLDATQVFQKYAKAAFQQMYQAEATAALKKLIHGEWNIDGRHYKMSEDQPYTYKQLSEYLGFITGGYKGDIPADLYRAARTMASNAAVSKVGFNPRSVLSQLTSNLHTLTNAGPKWWLVGLGEYLDAFRQEVGAKVTKGLSADAPKFVFPQESGDIKWRFKDPVVEEVAHMRGKGAVMKTRAAVAKGSMTALQMFDSITANIGWRAHYAKAMAGKVDGIAKGDKYMARTFANEEVTRTQSSASAMDLSPLQRKQWGKIVATLQNFVINEWGFVTRDVMGIRHPTMKTPERVQKVVMFYLGAALIDSLYEDVLGIRSPMNMFGSPSTLIRAAAEEKKKGKNTAGVAWRVAKEAAGTLPIFGRGLQYGEQLLGVVTDPLTQAYKFAQKLSGKNTKPLSTVAQGVAAAGSALGVPGSAPAARAIENVSRGGSPVRGFVGAQMEPATKPKPKTFRDMVKERRGTAQTKKKSFADMIKERRR